MLHCYWVPPADLAGSWPVLAELIEKAASTQVEWTLAGIVRRVMSGEWRLWMAWDDEAHQTKALMAVRIGETDAGERHCEVSFCVGDDMASGWPALVSNIEEWAKQNNCKRMVFATRPGWGRVMRQYGFETTHVIIEKAL